MKVTIVPKLWKASPEVRAAEAAAMALNVACDCRAWKREKNHIRTPEHALNVRLLLGPMITPEDFARHALGTVIVHQVHEPAHFSVLNVEICDRSVSLEAFGVLAKLPMSRQDALVRISECKESIAALRQELAKMTDLHTEEQAAHVKTKDELARMKGKVALLRKQLAEKDDAAHGTE